MLDRTGVNLNDFPGGNLSGQPGGKFTEFFHNGKDIPEEYYQEVDVRMENCGKDSFISMCGMRIADFFKHIWAKVTEALGLKKKQEEEQLRQKPDTPRRGMRR